MQVVEEDVDQIAVVGEEEEEEEETRVSIFLCFYLISISYLIFCLLSGLVTLQEGGGCQDIPGQILRFQQQQQNSVKNAL